MITAVNSTCWSSTKYSYQFTLTWLDPSSVWFFLVNTPLYWGNLGIHLWKALKINKKKTKKEKTRAREEELLWDLFKKMVSATFVWRDVIRTFRLGTCVVVAGIRRHVTCGNGHIEMHGKADDWTQIRCACLWRVEWRFWSVQLRHASWRRSFGSNAELAVWHTCRKFTVLCCLGPTALLGLSVQFVVGFGWK